VEPRTTHWFNNARQSPQEAASEPSTTSSESPTTPWCGPDDTEPSGDQCLLEIGQSIGKYQIRRRLGQGGQAQTFLAFDPDLRRDVVLKFYHQVKNSADGETVLNEGRALARVRSPFVAQCFGADRYQGIPYLVLEYVPGATLGELTSARRLEVPRAHTLAGQIAEGVAAIHACGLLHLDLKPSNILIGDDDRPRIVDFGLATTVGSDRLRQISGTPAYMAPEQARGDINRIDARSDVFGLGAVLYELLTGLPPYQGESQLSIWTQAKSGDVVPASQREPRLAAAVNDVCMRCLAKDPAARWRSADELRQRLAEFDRSQRKGFGFFFQLGRFKLQFSLGISLAGILLMAGGIAWMQGTLGPRQSLSIAMRESQPDVAETLGAVMGNTDGPVTFDQMAAPDMAGGQDKHGAGQLSESPLPLRFEAPSESTRQAHDAVKSQRDRSPLLRKAAVGPHDFAFGVEPVAPCRRSGETIVVPAGASLALELSTDRHCLASVRLRHANGAVVQLLPNEYDTDARLEPGVVRQIPSRRFAGLPDVAAEKEPAKQRIAEGLRDRLLTLGAGERAQLHVQARTGEANNETVEFVIPVQGEGPP